MIRNKFPLIAALLFFIFGILTLSDYGFTWDSPAHYWKGQAYLRFFLSGEKDYRNLKSERRSFYQSDKISFDVLFNQESIGHPSLNDALAAFSNYVFCQKLGIIDDVEAHNFFIVLISSLLVFVVFCLSDEDETCRSCFCRDQSSGSALISA